jgi:hypothetical protein
MHARQIGPLGAKPYVRKKSQIVFVGAGYRVLLAATDSNQRPVNGPSRSLAAAASHTRRLGSERGIHRSVSRGDEEPAGKTCRFAQIPHNASRDPAIKPSLPLISTARLQPVPSLSRSRTAGGTQESRGPVPFSAGTPARSRRQSRTRTPSQPRRAQPLSPS